MAERRKPKNAAARKVEKTRPVKKAGRGTDISDATQREVWARSGGICAFPDCQEVLYKNKYLLKSSNFGEVAHNVGSSAKGPRGDAGRSHQLSDDPDNLLLLCRNHHKLIDDKKGSLYPESVLRAWKTLHEANVRQAGWLKSSNQAVPIIVSGPIAGNPVHVEPGAVLKAMMMHGKAPVQQPATIDVSGDGDFNNSQARWAAQIFQAQGKLRRLLATGALDNARIAVFPLAEMPLLMAIGKMIGDKSTLDIHQFRRAVGSWEFEAPESDPLQFDFSIPELISGDVVITLGITAPISDDRFAAEFQGQAPTIINIVPSETGTGVVKTNETVATFRAAIRNLIDQLETRVSRSAVIHVMPAMPASLAFAFGTCITSKVSLPFCIYDARGTGAPFKLALRLEAE